MCIVSVCVCVCVRVRVRTGSESYVELQLYNMCVNRKKEQSFSFIGPDTEQ